MRHHGIISPRFWIGETGKKLRPDRDAQVLAAYLMTCPNSTMTGLYYLPIPTVCHETGIDGEGASEALRRVSELEFAYYDPLDEVVWVVNMLQHQVGFCLNAKDKRVKGIVNLLAPYREGQFFAEFVAKYNDSHSLGFTAKDVEASESAKAPQRGLEGAWKPHRSQGQGQGQGQGSSKPQEGSLAAQEIWAIEDLRLICLAAKIKQPKALDALARKRSETRKRLCTISEYVCHLVDVVKNPPSRIKVANSAGFAATRKVAEASDEWSGWVIGLLKAYRAQGPTIQKLGAQFRDAFNQDGKEGR